MNFKGSVLADYNKFHILILIFETGIMLTYRLQQQWTNGILKIIFLYSDVMRVVKKWRSKVITIIKLVLYFVN